jgi:hypothetical protein
MKNQISVAELNISEASLLTGKTRETVSRAARDLPARDGPGNSKLYDSRGLLQALYVGIDGPTYSEAMRRLTVAREDQVKVQTAQLREKWWPRDVVRELFDETSAIVRQTLIGNENKVLTFELVNDIFAQFRRKFAEHENYESKT